MFLLRVQAKNADNFVLNGQRRGKIGNQTVSDIEIRRASFRIALNVKGGHRRLVSEQLFGAGSGRCRWMGLTLPVVAAATAIVLTFIGSRQNESYRGGGGIREGPFQPIQQNV